MSSLVDMSRAMGVDSPVRRGIAAGALAFIAVAALVHVLLRTGMFFDEVWARGVAASPITVTLGAILDVHGWFLGGVQIGGDIEVLTVLPVIALLAAGFWTARGSAPVSPVDGFTSGATVVAGYLPVLVVAIVLMSTIGGGSGGETGTTTILKVVLTGICYPVVVGGIGGVLARQV